MKTYEKNAEVKISLAEFRKLTEHIDEIHIFKNDKNKCIELTDRFGNISYWIHHENDLIMELKNRIAKLEKSLNDTLYSYYELRENQEKERSK